MGYPKLFEDNLKQIDERKALHNQERGEDVMQLLDRPATFQNFPLFPKTIPMAFRPRVGGSH